MRYTIYLIFFITILITATAVFGQDKRYRIEVLVLTHLGHTEEPREVKWLEDYSDSVDFLSPPKEEGDEEGNEEGDAVEETNVGEEQYTAGSGETGMPEDVALPDDNSNAVVHIEEMSEVMQEAWRKLRLSAPFRPEQYLSWEQGSQAPFPVLRVHDLEVVLIEDAYAELRKPSEDETIVFGDMAGDEPGENGEEPELPDPTLFYRLDGTVTLTQTRFLHLDLDLQLREALFDAEWMSNNAAVVDRSGQENPDERLPTSFLVHRLQQRRQVKTARMEYFDNPVLGALVFVTGIEAVEEQE